MPTSRVRELSSQPAGFEHDWWLEVAELGWTGTLVPLALGGTRISGIGLSDLAVIAEVCGEAVAPGPLLPVNVAAAALSLAIDSGASPRLRSILGGLIDGSIIASWCHSEPGRTYFGPLSTTASREGDSWVISGTKTLVENGAEADELLVSAHTAEGSRLFIVPAKAPGVEILTLEALDLVKRFAEVRFNSTRVDQLSEVGSLDQGEWLIEYQQDLVAVMLCAEMVGASTRVYEFTLQYAFDRSTFGRPIASYQALKHRFADMKMWLEACHATLGEAVRAVEETAKDRAQLVSIAKSFISEHATDLIQECVQIHGGIGVTFDHDLHLYLRRVTLDRALGGTVAEHRERIADSLEVH
jgi:alkylation response protein AidB-like acyl-CoA dehydrogenase